MPTTLHRLCSLFRPHYVFSLRTSFCERHLMYFLLLQRKCSPEKEQPHKLQQQPRLHQQNPKLYYPQHDNPRLPQEPQALTNDDRSAGSLHYIASTASSRTLAIDSTVAEENSCLHDKSEGGCCETLLSLLTNLSIHPLRILSSSILLATVYILVVSHLHSSRL